VFQSCGCTAAVFLGTMPPPDLTGMRLYNIVATIPTPPVGLTVGDEVAYGEILQQIRVM
jgi:hypothetical protein